MIDRAVPGRGHRVYATQTVRVATVIAAPMRYVYDWCTDYRSDDWRLSPRRPRREFRVIRLSPHRCLRIRLTPTGREDPDVAVDVLRFDPPRAWHTDQIDEDDRETVDYRLTAVGPRRTRLDLLVTERYVTPRHPTKNETRERLVAVWQRYAGEIESRFREGRPALG